MPKTPDARPREYTLQGNQTAIGKEAKLDVGRDILQAILDEGGMIEDEYGRVSRKLGDVIGYLPTKSTISALSKAMQELAQHNLIEREIRANRTHKVRIKIDRVPTRGKVGSYFHTVVVPADPNEVPPPPKPRQKPKRTATFRPDPTVKEYPLKSGGTVYGYEERVQVGNEILRVLADQGGMVVQKDGRALRRLADLLGYACTQRTLDALSSGIQDLARIDMIDREVRAKRTYAIMGPETYPGPFKLPQRIVTVLAEAPVEDGNFADSAHGLVPLAPEEDQGVRVPLQETEEPDYDKLAAALLRQAVDKLSQKDETDAMKERYTLLVNDLNKQVDDLREELRTVKRNLKETDEQLYEARAERDQVRQELKESKEKLHRASHNANVLRQQLERRGNTHKVAETLDDESKRNLDKLMRELPNQ